MDLTNSTKLMSTDNQDHTNPHGCQDVTEGKESLLHGKQLQNSIYVTHTASLPVFACAARNRFGREPGVDDFKIIEIPKLCLLVP